MRLPLTKGMFAVIDDEDAERIARFKWHLTAQGYAARSIHKPVRSMVLMHRLIAQPRSHEQVDHINGDRLDNRRVNLRVCLQIENNRNVKRHSDGASGFKGVSFHKASKKWRAQICFKGHNKGLGYFETAELAHEFYCLAADMLFESFARHE